MLQPNILNNGLQLEYDNIEGMILLSELSRRRIRSIQKLIRVGRNEVVVVLRVDKEKGMKYQYVPRENHLSWTCSQAILTCQNAASPLRTLLNVKNAT